MNENLLSKHLRTALVAGFAALSVEVSIKQNYQPATQGTLLLPTLYFHKLPDKRYGWNRRNSEYDSEESKMIYTQDQAMETTFQINALQKRDIENENQLTATDLLNRAAFILSSETTKKYLMAQKIGILRIEDLTNTFFKDNFDQSESSPSFDVTLTHRETLSSEVPVIESTEYGFYRV